jgi:hypothetical protein
MIRTTIGRANLSEIYSDDNRAPDLCDKDFKDLDFSFDDFFALLKTFSHDAQ